MIRRALILISVLWLGISFAAPPSPAEASVEIVSAEFGTFDARNPGELVFEPTDVVPHQVGQRYGWIIEIRTSKRSLSVREEYLLPKTVTTRKDMDPASESLNIPTQRRNQASQRQLVPVDGKIYGEWAVGPNEPAGHRRLQVVIEGQVEASFEYDVK
ncbi:hypothetical protein [Propionivibrio sp.]|uniref:hypothetical protein n=1 Tax=Propionivibrio sp. TaxID=2212460 RepID=UPI003BF1233D